LRDRHAVVLLAAGAVAACATGTRQFGVALPIGFSVALLLAERQGGRFRAFLCGATFPFAIFGWQLWTAGLQPNFTQLVRLTEQRMFLTTAPLDLAKQMVWRVTVLAEYAALFTAAIIPAVLWAWFCSARNPLQDRRSAIPEILGLFGSLCLLLSVHVANSAPGAPDLVPRIPWVAGHLMPPGSWYKFVATAAAILSSAVLFPFLARRSGVLAVWRTRHQTGMFLVSTLLAYTVLHLVYVQLNDTYLIILVPFALLGVFAALRTAPASRAYAPLAIATATISGLSLAFWMRGDYNRQEAIWRSSEAVHAAGVDPLQISGSLHWVEYHGAFDRWLKTLGADPRPEDFSGSYRLHGPFYTWVKEQQTSAQYLIFPARRRPESPGYTILRGVSYRDSLMRPRTVYVVRRDEYKTSSAGSP
jgi:hypothetical protein